VFILNLVAMKLAEELKVYSKAMLMREKICGPQWDLEKNAGSVLRNAE
jgi:hypothetical protein